MKTEITPIHEQKFAFRRIDSSNPLLWLAWQLRLARQSLRRWSAARQAIRHLSGLDSYLLDDVGIDRSEIVEAVRGGNGQRQDPERQSMQRPASHSAGKLAA